MKKKMFMLAFGLLTLVVSVVSAQRAIKEIAPGDGGSGKACVITIIVPGEHTKYECKGDGSACSNVLECL
jgi:hypothetical protein